LTITSGLYQSTVISHSRWRRSSVSRGVRLVRNLGSTTDVVALRCVHEKNT